MQSKSRRRLFWVLLAGGIIGGLVAAHIAYYFHAKINAEQEMARDPRVSGYTIFYWNLPHWQWLMQGLVGGTVFGAILGWTVDAIRARMAMCARGESSSSPDG